VGHHSTRLTLTDEGGSPKTFKQAGAEYIKSPHTHEYTILYSTRGDADMGWIGCSSVLITFYLQDLVIKPKLIIFA